MRSARPRPARLRPALAAAFAGLALSACAAAPPGPTSPPAAADPQAAFLDRLRALCGQAFAGRLVSTDPQDAELAGRPMVMHVRTCEADRLRIPFHIGENRSRTWVLTRTPAGLELEHDHRHEDGTSEESTMYGGDTATPGTDRRQDFPADAHSKALFERLGRPASGTNVWTMEVTGDGRFVYQVERTNRRFRAEFDLTTPVPVPPAPWGG